MGMVEDMRNLCEDIVTSRFERGEAVKGIKRDTAELLKNYRRERKEISAELRRALDKGEEDRKKEFNEMMAGIKGDVSEIKRDTAELLDNYGRERKEMSAELRRDLDKGERERKAEFNEMMSGIKDDVADIKRDTAELLKNDERERIGMHEEWQRMVKPGVEVKVEAKEEEIEVEEAELGELRGKVLEIINACPGGISLTGIGLKLGVEWRKLIRPAKELLEEGRIRKEDLNYFPLKEEEI